MSEPASPTATATPPATGSRVGHQWPAFDGLRALAILAVMGYHVNIAHLLTGGYVGVDLFFVLSGFLITWLLVSERDATGSIQFRKFYARRALRLLPALAGVVVVALLVVQLDPGMAINRHSTYIALPFVAFYCSNWVMAFTAFGTLGMFSVMWSLAVEEQYYLAWPVLLNALSRRLRRQQIVWVLLAAAGAEMVARSLLNVSGVAWLFPYFSTATHSDGLLIGSALALWLSLQDLSAPFAGIRRWSAHLSVVGFGVLVVEVMTARGPSTESMGLWITLAVVASAAVIADLVVDPSSWRARLLALPPLQWIGRRSYGLYLWHIPVLTLLATLHLPPADLNLERFGLTFAITFPLAALSYRVIELPFLRRKGRFSVVTPGR